MVDVKILTNSELSWKRNGLYGRIEGQITQLKQLLTYPTTAREEGIIKETINELRKLTDTKKESDQAFGKIHDFKKYRDETI